jgi:hypothetical protein
LARKTDIRLRRSNTAGAVPSGSNLNEGELAINTADGALYFRKSDSTIITAHDNTIMHIDSTNNRVGIGTTSPDKTLDVLGDIRSINGSQQHQLRANQIISYGVDAILNAQSTGDDVLLRTQSTTRLIATAEGNIGIGTTSPTEKLHVVGGAATVKIESSTNEASLKYDNSTTTAVIKLANNDLKTELGGSEVMRILANGNVGIGTDSPSHLLELSNTMASSPKHIFYRMTGTNAAGGGAGIKFDSSASNNDASLYWAGIQGIRTTSNDGSNELRFWTTSAAEASGAPSQRMVISETGNVGIGTDDPLAPLDVVRGGTTGLSSVNARTALLVQNNLSNGTVLSINAKNTGYSGIFLGDQDNEAICQIQYVHTNDKLKFLTNGGGYNPLTISGQNVGIGTDSPSSILDVAGSAAVLTITDTRDQTFTVGDTMCSLAFDSDDTSGGAGTASHPRALISLVAETTFGSSTGLSFSTKQDTTTAPTEKMRINTAGDVGIGITSPDAKLRIDQNAIATGLKVTGGSSGSNIAEFVRDEGGTATVSVSGYSSNPQMNFASTGNTFSVGVRSNSFNIADHSYIDGTNVRLAIDNTGKVGIGTSAPTTKFQIVGSTNSAASSGGTLGIRQQGDGVGDGITITSSHSNSGRIYKDASGNLCFYNTGSSSTTDFVIENVTGNIGIGAADPKAQLQVKQLGINVNQSSVTSTSQYTCDSMSASDFRSARYTVQVTNTTDSTYQITEILLIHDGTTPSMTEYGTIFTGSAREASFDADISTGNVRLLATPASTDSMQFKVVRHSILV